MNMRHINLKEERCAKVLCPIVCQQSNNLTFLVWLNHWWWWQYIVTHINWLEQPNTHQYQCTNLIFWRNELEVGQTTFLGRIAISRQSHVGCKWNWTRQIVFSPLPSKKNIPPPKPWSFFPSSFYIVYAYCFHKCSIFILFSLKLHPPFFPCFK